MKYKVGDVVRLKRPHSEGDTVRILEIVTSSLGSSFGGERYKIYIPYWNYFLLDDEDIIEKVED